MADDFDDIEKYFEGRLNGEDKKHFEKKWEHDDAFAKEIAFYLRLKTELKKEKANNISSAIKADGSDQPKVKILFSRKTAFAIAASLLFIIGVFIIYNTNAGRIDAEAIASGYDVTFDSRKMMDNIRETKGLAANDLDEQKKRMQVLDSLYINDKTNCIELSENYLDHSLVTYFERETWLLKALSLKQTNKKDYSEAKIILEELETNGDTDYLDIVQWNLSLINLYQGDINTAKNILERMLELNPNSEYVGNAKDILEEIN